MNIYKILKYSTFKEIRKITIIIIVISLIPLVISGILYIKDFSIEKNWKKIEAIVTNYDINDSKKSWTEIKYEYNKNEFNVKFNSHPNYMIKGHEFDIYVNPTEPKEFKIANNLYKFSDTIFKISMSFLIILLIFIFPVYVSKKNSNN